MKKFGVTLTVILVLCVAAILIVRTSGILRGSIFPPDAAAKTEAVPQTADATQKAADPAVTQPVNPDVPVSDGTARNAGNTSAAQPKTAAAAETTVKRPDSVFSPRAPSNPDAVAEAIAWVRVRQDEINDNGAQMPETTQLSKRFNEGNAAFRKGDYELAMAIYMDLLSDCPAHYGAINNLALAMLQLGDNEGAFRYCVLNRVLNPSFYAGWINLDVAGYALGFGPAELQDMLESEFDGFPTLDSYLDKMGDDFSEADYNDNAIIFAHLYNLVYSDMEFDGDVNSIDKRMKELIESNPSDRDAQHLQKYWSILRILKQRSLDTPSDWAAEHVDAAVKAGLVPSGLQSDYAQPVTRAEFCALAVAFYEEGNGKIDGRTKFTDTKDVSVEKAAYAGIVFGVRDGEFEPDGALTREQAAAMLSRLAKEMGEPLKGQAADFSDKGEISDWAVEAVGQMQSSGVMGGTGNNMFSPQDPYTREQSIVTIMRLRGVIAR